MQRRIVTWMWAAGLAACGSSSSGAGDATVAGDSGGTGGQVAADAATGGGLTGGTTPDAAVVTPDVQFPADAGPEPDAERIPQDLGIDGAVTPADGTVAPPDSGVPGPCGGAGSTCQADADCGADAHCIAHSAAPDALCYCEGPRPVALRPCAGGAGNEGACCQDADCNGGVCVDFQADYCGGAPPQDINTCRYDMCASDAECPANAVCVNAGAFDHFTSQCAPAACRADSDCVARAGGTCRAFADRCSGLSIACHYDGDPCLTADDCIGDAFPWLCRPVVGGQGTECVQDVPVP